MFASLIGGGTNVIVRVFNPELVNGRHRAGKGHGDADRADHDPDADRSSGFQDRRSVVAAARSCMAPPRSARRCSTARWPGCRAPTSTRLYGMTELSPLATHLPWDQHTGEAATAKNRQRACGRAAIGCEVRDRRCRPQAGADRQGRRSGGARPERHDGLLGATGGDRQGRASTAGCTPATAATWTRTATSIWSIG